MVDADAWRRVMRRDMIGIGRPADRVQETQVGHGERLPWWRSRGGAAGIWVDGCSDLPIRRKPRSQPSIAATIWREVTRPRTGRKVQRSGEALPVGRPRKPAGGAA